MPKVPAVVPVFVIALASIAACRMEPSIPLDAPDGWTSDDRGRWWTAGVDTSAAFRDLGTFEAMGVVEDGPVYEVGRPISAQADVGRARLLHRLRRELMPLYRNHPEIVDSLFVRYVEPRVRETRFAGDADDIIAQLEKEAYRIIMRHFRSPAARTLLGRDIDVPIPDSLREMAAGQAVTFQIYVDTEGAPRAIRKLEPVHPVLDRIALRAVTRLSWQPAYLLGTTRSNPIDAWVRLSVRFPG